MHTDVSLRRAAKTEPYLPFDALEQVGSQGIRKFERAYCLDADDVVVFCPISLGEQLHDGDELTIGDERELPLTLGEPIVVNPL